MGGACTGVGCGHVPCEMLCINSSVMLIDRLFQKHFAVERLNYVNIYTNIYALNIKFKYYNMTKVENKNETIKTIYSD